MKNGQIALFVVVGLVILLVVGVVAMLRAVPARVEEEKEVESQSDFTVEPVREYVEECLRRVAEDALYHLGQEGGTIQRLADDNGYLEGTGYSVGNTLTSWENIAHADSSFVSFSQTQNSYRARILLPAKGFKTSYDLSGSFPLLAYRQYSLLPGFDTSISAYVTSFIRPDCLDKTKPFSDKMADMGYAVAELGEPVVDVRVSSDEKDMVAVMAFPLEVTDTATDKTVTLNEFTYRFNQRLSYFYHSFLKPLLQDEANSIKTNAQNNLAAKKLDGIFVQLEKEYLNGDVFVVTDPSFYFRGEAFTFRFARAATFPIFTKTQAQVDTLRYDGIQGTHIDGVQDAGNILNFCNGLYSGDVLGTPCTAPYLSNMVPVEVKEGQKITLTFLAVDHTDDTSLNDLQYVWSKNIAGNNADFIVAELLFTPKVEGSDNDVSAGLEFTLSMTVPYTALNHNHDTGVSKCDPLDQKITLITKAKGRFDSLPYDRYHTALGITLKDTDRAPIIRSASHQCARIQTRSDDTSTKDVDESAYSIYYLCSISAEVFEPDGDPVKLIIGSDSTNEKLPISRNTVSFSDWILSGEYQSNSPSLTLYAESCGKMSEPKTFNP